MENQNGETQGIPLFKKYSNLFEDLKKISRAAAKIDEGTVYETANPESQKIMYKMLDEDLLPGSRLGNIENFKEFYSAVKAGKRGLILSEHYSNMDLPEIIYLLDKYGQDWSKEFAHKIVAIAGMKLNEADPLVRAWAEGFTRVVIYPSRSLDNVESNKTESQEKKKEEEQRARKINLAAMRAMDACKRRGEVILVYPSGTRYRPGQPETKRGLREIDSYLRMFDIMILVSLNGNCLRIDPQNPDNMLADFVVPDVVIHTASPVLDCKQFRKDVLSSLPPDTPDPKQCTVDKVMQILQEQHDQVEKTLKM